MVSVGIGQQCSTYKESYTTAVWSVYFLIHLSHSLYIFLSCSLFPGMLGITFCPTFILIKALALSSFARLFYRYLVIKTELETLHTSYHQKGLQRSCGLLKAWGTWSLQLHVWCGSWYLVALEWQWSAHYLTEVRWGDGTIPSLSRHVGWLPLPRVSVLVFWYWWDVLFMATVCEFLGIPEVRYSELRTM